MNGLGDLLSHLEKAGLRPGDHRLYSTALTHASYVNEQPEAGGDNERLEFLGDAVLDFLVSDEIYSTHRDLPEGNLTRMRAGIVCEPSLARCAEALGLDRALMLGRGEESTGGRRKPSILAGCMEAVVAAVYLDGGLDAARRFVAEYVMAVAATGGDAPTDNKTTLQEALQARRPGVEISYRTVAEEGPDHDRTFTVEVAANGRTVGRGRGKSKRRAEQEAARDAISRLN
ncbi:MAG: ribonuclease III [Firmicutes bacterium]|nr:ribonuclease III [Bacillota bacterium]